MKQETIARIRRFSRERDWEQFHTPANLAKSIAIEAGELLECFQWSETEYDQEHIQEETLVITCYMITENTLLSKLKVYVNLRT